MMRHIQSPLAETLSNKRGRRRSECLTQHKGHGLDVQTDLMGGVVDGAETGDHAGKDDNADAHDKLLNHCGEADNDKAAENILVKLEYGLPCKTQFEVIFAGNNACEREDGTNCLTENGGKRCTGYAHCREAEVAADKQPVEADIHKVCDNVVYHRGLGVTCTS